MYTRNTELRKLPGAALYSITDILEINNDWQKIMTRIPKNPQSAVFEPKYNNEHMRILKDHAKKTQRKHADILFDEWSTSGRIRPTIYTLLTILIDAEIFRAADEIALMLQEPPPMRPSKGPAAVIGFSSILNDSGKQSVTQNTNNFILHNGTTKQMKSINFIEWSEEEFKNKPNVVFLRSDEDLIVFSKEITDGVEEEYIPNFNLLLGNNENSSKRELSNDGNSEPYSQSHNDSPSQSGNLYSQIDTVILEDVSLNAFRYRELQVITNKFSDHLTVTPKGPMGKIGSGGFGEVFVGPHNKYGWLAIKVVSAVAMNVFNTEVKSLSQLRHVNIVPILGFSIDGPVPCIVCEYVEGGTLEEKVESKVLDKNQRMDIMVGVSEGLKYIHNTVMYSSKTETNTQSSTSSKKSLYLHGDVKSANILLTKEFVPKLCDFGLSKQYDSTFMTKFVVGTNAYMAPESFSGTITQKNDIFSFGIVILELLTGLKPIIQNGIERINIKNYVEETCISGDISEVLDPVISGWTKAQGIYNLARNCLQMSKNLRPTMEEVCDILHRIKNQDYQVFYAQL